MSGSVLLIGFGVEGQAAARHFLAQGGGAIAAERSAAGTAPPEEFRDTANFRWLTEEAAMAEVPGAGLVLRSPGVPPDHPLIAEALRQGCEVTTPTGYWLSRHAPPGTLTVTGTKGKSTTVTLIVGLLTAMGKDAAPFGNIGLPPLDASPVTATHPVLELSSYMLHDVPNGPYTHLVTNLFRDHTPWHGGEAAYHAAKLRPFYLDPPRPGLAPRNAIEQHHLPAGVSTIEDLVHTENSVLSFNGITLPVDELPSAFRDGPKLLALQSAIAAIIKLTGEAPTPDAVKLATADFAGLPSRQEIVQSTDGRIWINDALATIPEAVMHALSAYRDAPVTLLLGGADRAQDFSGLVALLATRPDVRPIIFGSTAGRLSADLSEKSIAHEQSGSFEEAIGLAVRGTAKGGIILFSPAAASEPPHGNYTVRARIFREAATAA